jgi:hypothetical protein
MDDLPEGLRFSLSPRHLLGHACLARGLRTFDEAARHVQALPYSRPVGSDVTAVLTEGVGTCSSKHRFLTQLAHENGHHAVRLTVGIYMMDERNTPGVGSTLAAAGLDSLPEAHCYLALDGCRYDFTGLAWGEAAPLESLVSEFQVTPAALPAFKVREHRHFLSDWALRRGLDPDTVWRTREACIAALVGRTPA